MCNVVRKVENAAMSSKRFLRSSVAPAGLRHEGSVDQEIRIFRTACSAVDSTASQKNFEGSTHFATPWYPH